MGGHGHPLYCLHHHRMTPGHYFSCTVFKHYFHHCYMMSWECWRVCGVTECDRVRVDGCGLQRLGDRVRVGAQGLGAMWKETKGSRQLHKCWRVYISTTLGSLRSWWGSFQCNRGKKTFLCGGFSGQQSWYFPRGSLSLCSPGLPGGSVCLWPPVCLTILLGSNSLFQPPFLTCLLIPLPRWGRPNVCAALHWPCSPISNCIIYGHQVSFS